MATSTHSWIRQPQRVIRMVAELHRLGFQRLRIMPYEAPIAWRCQISPAEQFSARNGAYAPYDPDNAIGGELTTYTAASGNHYFDWKDAGSDNARALAEKFIDRFPRTAIAGRGRDWPYAGWLSELVGFLEGGAWLPFVTAEYFDTGPEDLGFLPIRDCDRGGDVRMDFPLPPRLPDDVRQAAHRE